MNWRLKQQQGSCSKMVRLIFKRTPTTNLQNFDRMTLQQPGHTGGIKKWLGSRSNPRENTLYAAWRSPPRRGLFEECRPSRRSRSFIWQSAETLKRPRGQPLHLLQRLGVVCKVRHAGLHSLLKIGQTPTCYKMGEWLLNKKIQILRYCDSYL